MSPPHEKSRATAGFAESRSTKPHDGPLIKPQLPAVNCNDLLGSNHSVVFVVTTNPNPDEVFTIFYGKGSVSNASTNRPKLTNFLEMERRVSWVRPLSNWKFCLATF